MTSLDWPKITTIQKIRLYLLLILHTRGRIGVTGKVVACCVVSFQGAGVVLPLTPPSRPCGAFD